MSELRVIDPGLMSSVQDLGRPGHRTIGVPLSGAFDRVAMRIGNRLVGNPDHAAVIETTMLGGVFEFSEESVVCLCGARSDTELVFDQPMTLDAGTQVRLGRLERGVRSYLCVRGGFITPSILGSRSSLVSLPAAGLGRPLVKNDVLAIGDLDRAVEEFDDSISISTGTDFTKPIILRVVESSHTSLFSTGQLAALEQTQFVVHDQSNRVGVRLTGEVLQDDLPTLALSEGVLPGMVQVPSSGKPIVLGVDGPTTGGYPVIASIIKADLHRVAQCGPRATVHLRWVSRQDAIEANRILEESIQAVRCVRPRRVGHA